MLYGNCIERFKTMDNVKTGATFLDYHELLGVVRGVGMLVDPCINFSADDFTHLIIDPWWDRHVVEYPGFMFDYWHDDWQKEVFPEAATLCVIPGETPVLNTHKMVH